jgi:hypothetical protein
MEQMNFVIEKEIKIFCAECEKEFGVQNLYELWINPSPARREAAGSKKGKKESYLPSPIGEKFTKEEWDKMLTFAYHQYIKHKFKLPYRATLFDGSLEGWIQNCKQIQYGERIRIATTAYEYKFKIFKP